MNIKTIKSIVCAALAACYLAGMVLLLMGRVHQGITLWSISTIGGLVVLWYLHSSKRDDDRDGGEDGK